MRFATLYFDEGNLLGFYEDLESARAEVLALVDEHPDVAEDFGIIEFDEDGRRAGDFLTAADLVDGPPARSGR